MTSFANNTILPSYFILGFYHLVVSFTILRYENVFIFCSIYSRFNNCHNAISYIMVNFGIFLDHYFDTLGKDKINIYALGGIRTRDPVYRR